MMKPLHVVVGILRNEKDEVLIALRPAHVAQPGVWEFPGGKVEPDESLENALIREYQEEIGVDIIRADLFHQVEKAFPEKNILLILHTFFIRDYHGTPYGREGQEVRWVAIDALCEYTFPEANAEIVKLLEKNQL